MKKILLMSLVLVGLSANAANWQLFTQEDGTKQYFDHESYKLDQNTNTVTIWEKRVGVTDPAFKKGTHTLKIYNKFFCSQNQYKILQILSYDKQGKFMGEIATPKTFVNVAPDTISEDEYKAACGD